MLAESAGTHAPGFARPALRPMQHLTRFPSPAWSPKGEASSRGISTVSIRDPRGACEETEGVRLGVCVCVCGHDCALAELTFQQRISRVLICAGAICFLCKSGLRAFEKSNFCETSLPPRFSPSPRCKVQAEPVTYWGPGVGMLEAEGGGVS